MKKKKSRVATAMEAASSAATSTPAKSLSLRNKKESLINDPIKENLTTADTAESGNIPETITLNRKKKKIDRPYTAADLHRALDAVNSGMPVKTAARLFNIPKTTLLYKKRGKLPPTLKVPGPECILGEENERNLVQWILHMSRNGFPISRDQLLDSVYLLLKELKMKTKFKDNRPGRHWYAAFKNRHPELAERMSQNLTRSRAAVTEEKLREWFREVHEYLEARSLLNIDASRVFNCDESAFFLSPKGSTVLAKKGEKTVYNFISNDEKECLTTLVCASASGVFAPPMVIFPYKRIPGHIATQMPENWSLGHSNTGWMTGETFYSYISNVFYRWLIKNGVVFPVILFVDGHTSHLTLTLSDFCREKGIELIALYPNATHILQPLDVALFHPLKTAWAKVVRHWRLEKNGERVKREDFAGLLQRAIETLDSKSILKNGFEKTGLYPFSADAIEYKKYFKNTDDAESFSLKTHDNGVQNADFLQFVENNIGNELLTMFREVEEEGVWNGDEAHKSLFYFWLKIKGSRVNEVTHVISADSVVDETLVNDENEPLIHREPRAGEVEQEDGAENERNATEEDGAVSVGVDAASILQDDDLLNLPLNETDFENNTLIFGVDPCGKLVPLKNVHESLQTETEKEELSSQYVDDKLNAPASPIPSTSNTATVEPQSQFIDENPEEQIASNPLKSNPEVNIPPGIPSPFKKAFFWPRKKEQLPKNTRPKEKVPPVLTSEQWIQFAKYKEEKKEKEEAEKKARKEERLKKAQLRQEQQEIAKAARLVKQQQQEIARAEKKIQKEEAKAAKKIKKEALDHLEEEPSRKRRKKKN